jgi:hypothetical protein
MNNIMHDVWYQYGFNELNGNFQETIIKEVVLMEICECGGARWFTS